MQNLIDQLGQLLGQQFILTDDQEKAPYLTDWRKRFTVRL